MAVNCPKCGAKYERLNVNDDKSNIIGHAAGMTLYGKKYLCKDCTHQFTDKELGGA
ncbi:MAG: hypothetical protein ACXAE3_11090 [Candidatus Kariarchaeaceae archaeon]|jgi:transposase-like protein